MALLEPSVQAWPGESFNTTVMPQGFPCVVGMKAPLGGLLQDPQTNRHAEDFVDQRLGHCTPGCIVVKGVGTGEAEFIYLVTSCHAQTPHLTPLSAEKAEYPMFFCPTCLLIPFLTRLFIHSKNSNHLLSARAQGSGSESDPVPDF